MISDIRTSLRTLGSKFNSIDLSVSFSRKINEYDFLAGTVIYSIGSWLDRIVVRKTTTDNMERMLSISSFDKSAVQVFLSKVKEDGVGNIDAIAGEMPGYRQLFNGKEEDGESFEMPLGEGLLTKKEVEDKLGRICEGMAAGYNEGKDGWETNANGYYVNREEQKVEFEFTVMNDKFWQDIPFDTVKEEYGLDIEFYQDYFKN